jgi:pimeloyl-ACP methyl ester carboxylesterase
MRIVATTLNDQGMFGEMFGSHLKAIPAAVESLNQMGITRREFLVQTAAISLATSGLPPKNAVSAQAPAKAFDSESRRRADLEMLLKIFPPTSTPITGRINAFDTTWEDWVKRTGELPPDFENMQSIPNLPDPLLLTEGGRQTPVTNEALWRRQKQWIRTQMGQWVFGKMPPQPDNLRAVVTASRREGRITVRDVRLEFGPDHRATLRVQLIIPEGKGPFPVFLTNHSPKFPWLYTAVRRGYMGCYYAANDPTYGGGDSDDSDRYIEVYPEYDFYCIARWGWSASRAVDYLTTLPEVDKNKIGLAGHSRHGKQALLAAAFDERIGALIVSSGNTGECNPWRYTTNMFVNESIEKITSVFPHWFHPRLRFFAGREDKLPVDQNMLAALVAPRGLMMNSGYGESEGNPFGYEQTYRSVGRVYGLLGHQEKLWLNLRDGEHPTAVADVELFMDFLDSVFGRNQRPRSETWILGYTFEGWQRVSREKIDPLSYPKRSVGDFVNQADGRPIDSVGQWEEKKKSIFQRISFQLGQAPPRLPFEAQPDLTSRSIPRNGSSEGWLATLYDRPIDDQNAEPRLKLDRMGVVGLPFGDGLMGELFYPVSLNRQPKSGRWPVVIWLHPYSYQNGWSAGRPWLSGGSVYDRDFRPSFELLTARGFAVFAFDQVGFGARIHEAKDFYDRYPRWSILGNMIEDTRAAVSALANLAEIDSSRIFLMGYALGAKVGLLTAGFEDCVKGLVSVCGIDPLRLDTPEKGTEGIRQYSHLHGLLPRLGFFVGNEDRLPFDFDEVLALVAPKPTLVISPTLDRYARLADVRREVEASKKVYALLGHPEALQFETPVDFNRFAHRTQEIAFDWLARQL